MRTVRRVARMPGDARDSSVSRTRGSPGGDASVSVATPRRRISFESLSAAALAPSTVCQFGGHRTGIARGEKGSSNDIVGGYRRPSPAARLPRRRGFTRSASVSSSSSSSDERAVRSTGSFGSTPGSVLTTASASSFLTRLAAPPPEDPGTSLRGSARFRPPPIDGMKVNQCVKVKKLLTASSSHNDVNNKSSSKNAAAS